MAQATRTYAGLDIGTTKISCIVADQDASGELRIVGIGNAPSEGLRRGAVVDLEKTFNAQGLAKDVLGFVEIAGKQRWLEWT